jgi:hypothetical protein
VARVVIEVGLALSMVLVDSSVMNRVAAAGPVPGMMSVRMSVMPVGARVMMCVMCVSAMMVAMVRSVVAAMMTTVMPTAMSAAGQNMGRADRDQKHARQQKQK